MKKLKRKRFGKRDTEAKLGLLVRTASFDLTRADDDGEDRTIEFSFSSEEPYERYFGWETLGHKRGEVMLETLRDAGAFLKDHNTRDQIGVVEKAWIDTAARKGRVWTRFGRRASAEEERIEVLEGIRTKVSVGYIVHEMILERSDDTGDHYRVTKWEPIEVSTVAIPADATVGMGRDLADEFPALAARAAQYENHRTRIVRSTGPRKEHEKMNWITVTRLEDGFVLRIREKDFDDSLYERFDAPAPAQRTEPTPPADPTPARTAVTGGAEVDHEKLAREAFAAERKRVADIKALGAKFNSSDRASEAIEAGTSYSEFRMALWEAGATTGGEPNGERTYPSLETPAGQLGLSDKETRSYSILRAIRSHIDKDPRIAPYERECSDEIEKTPGMRPPSGFYVPRELLTSRFGAGGSADVAQRFAQLVRAISVGGTGGELVATELHDTSFIEILRNQSVALAMGATHLPGLVGDVDIPRQATAASAGWGAEGDAAANSELTLDSVDLRPKTLSAKSKLTRRLMLQSTPAAEGLVRADLASAVALGLDAGALTGTGASNQPTGILNMSGVSVVALGTNGAAPTWQSQAFLVRDVRAANAHLGSLAFVSSTDAWASLLSTERVSGDSKMILEEPGDRLLGRRFMSSEQMPNNLVKGSSGAVCSAEIYGNWSDLLIGEWGTLDLFPDPYSDGDEGAVILRVFQDADVQARHEESFSVIKDMLTT